MGFAARPYNLPLRTPYRWAKGEHARRQGVLVRLRLDDATGWGEVAPAPHEPVDGRALVAAVRALVDGCDPRRPDFLARVEARAPPPRLRAAIATAWFTARATLAGRPLHAELAPGRAAAARVPINGLVGERTVKGALAQSAAYVAQGMGTLKVKCCADVAQDLVRVEAIRAAHPQVALRLDPNDAWRTVPDALRNLERFADFGIAYVEDPLAADLEDLPAMVAVRERSPIPVAWDRPLAGLDAMRRLLDAGAADVLVLKLPRVGGPDIGLAMIDLAHRHGVPCVSTGPLETAVGTVAGLHVAALTPPPLPDCGFSLSGHFAADVAAVPPVVDGARALPTAPGLGVNPDDCWAALPGA